MEKNINVITDLDGRKIVLINDIRFKGKTKEEWNEVEEYLKEYVGKFYEIAKTSEKVYIGKEFKIVLKGPNAKAKANASQNSHYLHIIVTEN